MEVVLFKNHLHSLKSLIISGESDIMKTQFLHFVILKIPLGKHFRDFSSPVGPEVETNHKIPVFYASDRLSKFIHLNNWPDKLIGNTVVIGFSDRIGDVLGTLSFTKHKGIISQFHALPPFVPVHRIVPTDNRRDFTHGPATMSLQILEIT